MNNVGTYAKAIVALITAGLGALSLALADGHIDTTEWVAIATAVVVALGVYVTPNSETSVVDESPEPAADQVTPVN